MPDTSPSTPCQQTSGTLVQHAKFSSYLSACSGVQFGGHSALHHAKASETAQLLHEHAMREHAAKPRPKAYSVLTGEELKAPEL